MEIIRNIEIWKRIEVLQYPNDTQWKIALKELNKKHKKNCDIKVRGRKTRSPKVDEFLTGIEKQVFHHREELPKMTRKQRLKRFKDENRRLRKQLEKEEQENGK